MDESTLRTLMAPELPPGLIAHIDRVVALGVELAERHRLATSTVRLAARGHDLLRAVAPAELLARADARGLTIDAVERREPVLLHGPLAAIELAERFELHDADVLHAVHWHTTGHPDFSAEAWAMFVADKVEPDKVHRRPALAHVRALADVDLQTAALAYLDLTLHAAADEGWELHPVVNATRNALIARAAGRARAGKHVR